MNKIVFLGGIFSDLGQFGSFWGKLEGDNFGDTFGVQAWEENKRSPLIGVAERHLIGVLVPTRHSE